MKNTSTKFIMLFVLIIILLFVSYFYYKNVAKSGFNTISVDYICSQDKTIKAKYHNISAKTTTENVSQNTVDLSLGDNRKFTLTNVVSADGAKYTNSDESIIFWSKAKTAFLNENGQATYSDCIEFENIAQQGDVVSINDNNYEGDKLEYDLNNDGKKEIIFQQLIGAANVVQLIITDNSGQVLYSTLTRAGKIEIKDYSVFHTSSIQNQETITKFSWNGKEWISDKLK